MFVCMPQDTLEPLVVLNIWVPQIVATIDFGFFWVLVKG